MSRRPDPTTYVCRACHVVLNGYGEAVSHEGEAEHARNEDARQSWRRIESAVHAVYPGVCAPRWIPPLAVNSPLHIHEVSA